MSCSHLLRLGNQKFGVNWKIFVEIGAQMCLSMICLLRLSFKIGNLCNALFVYDVANNFYLITRILKKIIDIVCFKNFLKMTIVLRQQFYTSFTNLLCNLINFYVIHDVKVIFYIKFQIPFLNKIAQKILIWTNFTNQKYEILSYRSSFWIVIYCTNWPIVALSYFPFDVFKFNYLKYALWLLHIFC